MCRATGESWRLSKGLFRAGGGCYPRFRQHPRSCQVIPQGRCLHQLCIFPQVCCAATPTYHILCLANISWHQSLLVKPEDLASVSWCLHRLMYAPPCSAYESSMEAIKQPTIRVVAVIAEGVPEADTKKLIAYAKANNKILIGPATVGGVQVCRGCILDAPLHCDHQYLHIPARHNTEDFTI